MRHSEVWRVSGLARDRHIVIVSADAVNTANQFPAVQGVPILDDAAAPTHLLVTELSTPLAGKALIAQVGPSRKTRLVERLGEIPADELAAIRRALAALYDL